MSCITLPAVANAISDFNKAIISLWFRVSQAALDAAATRSAGALPTIVPLLTFGQRQRMITYGPQINVRTNSSAHAFEIDFNNPILGGLPEVTGQTPVDPCFIGLIVFVDRSTGPTFGKNVASVFVNLQTATFSTITAFDYALTNVNVYSLSDGEVGPGQPPPAGDGWGYQLGGAFFATQVDNSGAFAQQQPELVTINTSPTIHADTWHHLLFSCDLNNAIATKGSPTSTRWATTSLGTTAFWQAWYAIDDKNYNSPGDLGPFNVDGSDNPQAILSQNAYSVANSPTIISQWNLFQGPGQFNCASADLPMNASDIGIPASSPDFVAEVGICEMAELQVYTGFSLDTGDVAKRRLFVDKNGKPVFPTTKDPVSQKSTIDIIGKKPDIYMHTYSNFKKGKNLGTAGDFTTIVAKSKPFKPDPQIGK